MKKTYRKSWAVNLLMWSDLTFGFSFKVKQGQPELKVLITHLLLVQEVCSVKPTISEIMGCESFDLVTFDLWPLLQGQTRIGKLKSAYNSLIIGPRDLQCETNL